MLTGCHIVAHRGYSGKYPENSPEAFQQALQLPIHGLECDIRVSRDGQAVVIHDPSVDRTSNGTGMVARMTWPELQRLNIGTEKAPQQLMLVDDLLRLLDGHPHHLYIETKPLVRPGLRWKKLWRGRCTVPGWVRILACILFLFRMPRCAGSRVLCRRWIGFICVAVGNAGGTAVI